MPTRKTPLQLLTDTRSQWAEQAMALLRQQVKEIENDREIEDAAHRMNLAYIRKAPGGIRDHAHELEELHKTLTKFFKTASRETRKVLRRVEHRQRNTNVKPIPVYVRYQGFVAAERTIRRDDAVDVLRDLKAIATVTSHASAVLCEWLVRSLVQSSADRVGPVRVYMLVDEPQERLLAWRDRLADITKHLGSNLTICPQIPRYVLGQPSPKSDIAPRRLRLIQALMRRRLAVLSGASAIGIAFLAWHVSHLPAPPPPPALTQVLSKMDWIGYEPTNYDPDRNQFPPVNSIQDDLARLKEFGFSGVITYSSRGSLGDIPDAARAIGLKVIAGLRFDTIPERSLFDRVLHSLEPGFCWIFGGSLPSGWPADLPAGELRDELEAAIRHRNSIDGYIVGHNFDPRGNLNPLYELLDDVRCRTGKPVSTTRLWSDYTNGQGDATELVNHVNWISADIGVVWRGGLGSWQQEVALFKDVFGKLVTVAGTSRKPALAQVVAFPSGGWNFNEDDQRQFFREVLAQYRTDSAFLGDKPVWMVPFLAFDSTFKAGPLSYNPAEARLGLFTDKRMPKPAACEFVYRRPSYRGPRTIEPALKDPSLCPESAP